MPVPEYIQSLRAKVGRDLLMLPGVGAIVFNAAGDVLLQKRSDFRIWAPIGGILDPGEEPADAAVREVREETGVEVVPERVSGIYTTPVITYPNGDRAVFTITCFACRAVRGEPRVNDDESLDVRYFDPQHLPDLRPDHRLRIDHALAGREAAFFQRGLEPQMDSTADELNRR